MQARLELAEQRAKELEVRATEAEQKLETITSGAQEADEVGATPSQAVTLEP